MFEKGEPVSGELRNHFIGQVYVKPLIKRSDLSCPISNVVFEAGARNSWHKHTGGQIFLCISGRGLYQEKGKEARVLLPGDVVEIVGTTYDSYPLSQYLDNCTKISELNYSVLKNVK